MPYLSARYQGGIRPQLATRLHRDVGNLTAIGAMKACIKGTRGLLLGGGVGTGKTSILAEIDLWTEALTPRALVTAKRCRLVAGMVNVWTDASELCADMKTWMDFSNPDRQAGTSAEAECTQAYRLFLDDLGIEQSTEWNAHAIGTILHRRYAAGLATYVSTNLSPAELSKRYGERIFSRLVASCITLELGGSDRRLAVAAPKRLRAL